MDMKTYEKLALNTMADQELIQRRIAGGPTRNVQFDNGVRGLCDEAGELSDISKRIIEYGKGSIVESRDHIKEEVGDCFWRLRQICDAAGLTFEECMISNWNKLNNKDGRYPNGYSDFRAAEENRDREAEKRVMTIEKAEIVCGDCVLEQNGQGFAEPPDESTPSVGAIKPLGHSYTRRCIRCNKRPVHKSNSTGICPDCYRKEVEPSDV